MANAEHLAILEGGVQAWNTWRTRNPAVRPRLDGANLFDRFLSGANLRGADLRKALLQRANLSGAMAQAADFKGADLTLCDLSGANFTDADLTGEDTKLYDVVGNGTIFVGANLSHASLTEAHFSQGTDFSCADLSYTDLDHAYLCGSIMTRVKLHGAHLNATRLGDDFGPVDLSRADLHECDAHAADFTGANLAEADLRDAYLGAANLTRADLTGADLTGANLTGAQMVETSLGGATISGCTVYGISAWRLGGVPAAQSNLIITPPEHAVVTVDNLEVAQFIYLLLDNRKIRAVLETIGSRGVLILGRFGERMHVLERLRGRLRDMGFLPIVFDFERPKDRDFTETVKTLAGLSAFIIADITAPKSVPMELQATVPDYMLPFKPIIEKGEEPFPMFRDLQLKYDWVLPKLEYESADQLIEVLEPLVVLPAMQKRKELIERRARTLEIEDAGAYLRRLRAEAEGNLAGPG